MKINVVAIFLAFVVPAFCQAPPSTVTTANSTGLIPYNVYGGSRENINLGNGNLNLQVPLLSLPGRAGNGVELALVYDSKIWQLSSSFDPWIGYPVYVWNRESAAGWRLGVPYITSTAGCVDHGGIYQLYEGNFVVTMPDGSKHSFKNKDNSKIGYTDCNGWQDDWSSMNEPLANSTDTSFSQLDTSPSDHAVLRLKNGTKVYFYGTTFIGASPTSIKVVDTNGNRTTYNYSSGRVSSIVDTVGRVITFSYPSNATHTISYKDSNGTTQTITLNYTQQTLSPSFSAPLGAGISGNGAQWVLSSINMPLPSNRVAYAFEHNTFGELTKVVYPSGGYTRYEYAAYQAWLQLSVASTSGDFRQLTAKNVCAKATGDCTTAEEASTTYTPTIAASYSNNSHMTVRDPDGDKAVHEFNFTQYATDILPTGSSCGDNEVLSPREQTRSLYSGETTLWRTVVSTYVSVGCPQELAPATETTTLLDVSPNLVSKVERDYGTIDNVTEEREYDYGLALKRKKKYTYLGVHPSNGVNYPASLFIKDRRIAEETYDGSSTLFAKTEYEYDVYSEGITGSGAVEREPSYGTGYTTRGNVTAVTRHKWQTGVPGTAYFTTRMQFDDAGNVRKSTDPGGHFTTISYVDYWNNAACTPSGGNAAAYPKSITNHKGHVVTNRYNSCTGTLASTTDPNSQTTSFTYDALARRLTLTLPPTPAGTGSIVHAYNEASLPLTASTTTAITTSLSKYQEIMVDGLGRFSQSALASPNGFILTATCYNQSGQVSKKTYPVYSAGGFDSSPCTNLVGDSFTYDSLARLLTTTHPDGSYASNVYSGNEVTSYDQTLRPRKTKTDGLGRLIEIREPHETSGLLIYETAYWYDALDNLTGVDQRGNDPSPANWRSRRFTYDSLSQLVTARNPESGLITYSYSNDGEVITKTAPKPNQTGSLTVTTTYEYDELHRLKAKNNGSYLQYFYDVSPEPSFVAQNAIGRLTMESNNVNAAAYHSYDAMGRLVYQTNCIPSYCNWNTNPYTAEYYLDGSLKSLTYPSGRNVTYGYDSAGRLNDVKFNAFGTTSVNYHYWQVPNSVASSPGYHASGAPQYVDYGNSIRENTPQDNRLRQSGIYIYHLGSGLVTADRVYSYQANSNISKIWDYPLASGKSQNFTYDALNRIWKAWSDASSGSNAWGQEYVIDPWGNLTKKLPYDGLRPNPDPLDQSALANNTLTGFAYDAAGNMTQNGTAGYTYDNENRIVATAGQTYTYDANGMRVRKQTDANNFTEYIYFGSQVIAEKQVVAGGPPVWTDYIFAGGKRIAKAPAEAITSNTEYYHSDHLGTANWMTNAGGAQIYSATYLPYGYELNPSGSTTNHYKFTGKERDTFPGTTAPPLDYFGARYYGSTMGRFVSVDPFNPITDIDSEDEDEREEAFRDYLGSPQNWNRYTYALNGPTIYIDEDGRVPVLVVVVVAARVAPVAIPIAARYGPQVLHTLRAAGPAVSQSLFALGNSVRGGAIELIRGAPNAFRFIKGIDNFANGVATQIKSLDIFAKSYQNLSTLASTLNRYVNQLYNYPGGRIPGNLQLQPGEITRRVLEVVLPKGNLTVAQQQVLRKIQQDAAAKGVQVIYIQLK